MFTHFQNLVREFDVTLLDEWGGNVSTLEDKLFAGRNVFTSRGSYGGSYNSSYGGGGGGGADMRPGDWMCGRCAANSPLARRAAPGRRP